MEDGIQRPVRIVVSLSDVRDVQQLHLSCEACPAGCTVALAYGQWNSPSNADQD